jgi:hypothetical protein
VRVALLLVLAACGRIDFDPVSLAWVATVLHDQSPANMTASFSPFQARAPGDAIVLHVACDGGGTATTVTASAPGWTFTQLGQVTGMPLKWGALFVAVAPDAAPTTLTYTFDTNCSAIDTLADEFSNVDPTAPFDAFDVTSGTADCQGTLTTARAGDAVWAGCSTSGTTVAVGSGYTKAGDDTNDDWSEYKLTTDPAGTLEQAEIVSKTGGLFVMTMVAIAPR